MTNVLNSLGDPSAALVSLCEFRRRSTETVPAEVDEGYEPLAGVIREVGRELAADGVLVAWHAADAAPTFLFASGACEPQSDTESDMLKAACSAADDVCPDSVRWAATICDDTALLTTRIAADDGVVTVTTFFRGLGRTARSHARDTATRWLPIVQGVLRLWSLRAHAMATNRGLAAALNTSAIATLLVDRVGRILFANAVADRLLSTGDGLRRAGKTLSGTRLSETMRLHAAIEHVGHGSTLRPLLSPVVALTREHKRPLLAAVVCAQTLGTPAGEAAAVIHIFDTEQNLEPLLTPVCRLYRLSPVETRLACLLARGVALTDAANTMRVKEQTARSYLKQVFVKTDTNRQAELVWLMLKSAVRTAPDCPTHLT